MYFHHVLVVEDLVAGGALPVEALWLPGLLTAADPPGPQAGRINGTTSRGAEVFSAVFRAGAPVVPGTIPG